MRESIRKDRQEFKLAESVTLIINDKTKITEGSIKWETQLSLSSYSQKILKKTQNLASTEKVKIINTYVPEKAKLYIENYLLEELNYFQKIFLWNKILSNQNFIIPEYKIDLLNKTKKLINSIENINKVLEIKKIISTRNSEKKDSKKSLKKDKAKTKKTKIKKKLKTLWVRRKKKV